jgi:anthranilate/para-aminobenzoate synthase component I
VKIRAALPQGWRTAYNKGRAVLLEASLPIRLSAQALAQAWLASTTQRPFYLLETPTGPRSKRFALLAGEPFFVLEGRGAKAWVVRGHQRVPLTLPPEKALARLGRALKAQGVASVHPGWVPLVGALSFEAGARFEAWRLPKPEPLGLPDWSWALPSRWAWRCGSNCPWKFRELAPSRAFLTAIAKSLGMTGAQLAALATAPVPAHFEGWLAGLEQQAGHAVAKARRISRKARVSDTRDSASFGRMIKKAQAEISAGEYYQANLSHRLSAPFKGDPFQLYQALVAESPSPMGAYVDLGDTQVISASPERLFRQEGSLVETRPIAGTAPNLGRAGERQALFKSEKDGAEHVMLVDLERNDLGRVCVPGSVKVPRFKTVETYAHVHHLVSQVRGRLAPGKDFMDLLRAGFPGGSITGAPKPRVLEAIAELEGQRRGWYTGGMGYWDPLRDRADFNILIRTAWAQAGKLTWSVGGGIVADSKAKKEWVETLAKGKAILKVLQGRE